MNERIRRSSIFWENSRKPKVLSKLSDLIHSLFIVPQMRRIYEIILLDFNQYVFAIMRKCPLCYEIVFFLGNIIHLNH